MTWGGAFDTAVIHVTSSVHTITNVYAKKDGIVYTGVSTGTNAFDIKVNDKGTYEIWASVDGASTSKISDFVVYEPTEYTFYIDAFYADSVLKNNSWSTIKAVSRMGRAADYWAIGDKKYLSFDGVLGSRNFKHSSSQGYSVQWTRSVKIIGINHNSEIEGNNLIHFMFGFDNDDVSSYNNMINDPTYIDAVPPNNTGTQGYFCMKISKTAVGGWQDCYVRKDLLAKEPRTLNRNTTIYSALSEKYNNSTKLIDNLSPVIKYSNNYQGNIPNDSELAGTPTQEEFFICSAKEIDGKVTDESAYEAKYQKQYEYFKQGNAYYFFNFEYGSGGSSWTPGISWTRSVSIKTVGQFIAYDSKNSRRVRRDANYSLGIVPCFCV